MGREQPAAEHRAEALTACSRAIELSGTSRLSTLTKAIRGLSDPAPKK
jgi:hypothetical protein